MKKFTHSFPTSAALHKKAAAEADRQYQASFEDKTKTLAVIETIKKWIVEKTNESIVDNAKCDVSYNVERPYDYFHLLFTLDTAALTKDMMSQLKRSKGEKTFPFKLKQESRQNALGFIALQTFTESGLKEMEGFIEYGEEGEVGPEAGVGTHLSFVFVEW